MKEESASRLVDIAIACSGGALSSGEVEGLLEAVCEAVGAAGGGYYEALPGGDLRLTSRYGRFRSFRERVHSSQWVQLAGHEPLKDYTVRCFKGAQFPWLLKDRQTGASCAMALFFRLATGGIALVLLDVSGEDAPTEARQALAGQAGRLLSHRWGNDLPRRPNAGMLPGAASQIPDGRLEMVRSQIQKRETLETLSELAGKVSHEIRNPLGAIRNGLYWLSRHHHDEQTKRRLKAIENEINRCTDVIEGLLAFSRPVAPAAVETDLNCLVEEILAGMDVPDRIETTTELEPDLPKPAVDRDLVRKAIANLITNAVESMPGGGRLRLKTCGSQDWVEVAVEDTGSAIRPDHMDRIFDPLFTTKDKGVGLGLISSLNIVQAHGGTVEATSRLGKGSRFSIRLSLKGVAAQRADPPVA